jgi:hypothetical protein
MKSPLITDPNEIRRMSEALAKAEGEKFQPNSEPCPDPLGFPPIMSGVAGNFADLYSSVLEAPKHFFYVSFLTCLGSAVADRIQFEGELQTQIRLYTLLLGQSADDRKSTAIDKTIKFFADTLTDFHVCWGVGSAEGLQKQMEESGKLLLCQDGGRF